MSYYNNINDLRVAITKQMQSVLKNEVSKSLRDEFKNIIQQNVYDRYTPSSYKRRLSGGGLLSKNQMISTNKGTSNIARIFFTTQAKGNPDKYFSQKNGFLKRIEYGDGSAKPLLGTKQSPYNQPRPFMSTLKNSNKQKIIVEPLKQGLKNRGFKTF